MNFGGTVLAITESIAVEYKVSLLPSQTSSPNFQPEKRDSINKPTSML